jgi:hypothetical protein
MNLSLIRIINKNSILCKDISLISSKKSQVLTCLTVCLAASALLTSTQAAVAATTDQLQHLICVKSGQQLICNEANPHQNLAAKNHQENLKSRLNLVPQLFTSTQQDFLANNLLWLSYLLPASLALGLFLSDRYAGYRMAVLNQQIQTLEKLWQHGVDP